MTMLTIRRYFHITLVSNLGVNYPNLVMGPFEFGKWAVFSINVVTTTYFIEH